MLIRKYIFQDKIYVSNCNTQKVHNDWVPQQWGKPHEHPGQKGGLEVEKAKEVHANIGVPSAPQVDEHYCKGLAQGN